MFIRFKKYLISTKKLLFLNGKRKNLNFPENLLLMDTGIVYKRSEKLVVRKIKEDSVIVPVSHDMSEMDFLYTLNPTATFIWESINGKNSMEDIARKLESEFEVDIGTARSDVADFMYNIKDFLEPV